MAQLREIIDYSKANPETEYARRALMLLKRGDFDEQARQEQIDLSFVGRQTTQQQTQEAPAEVMSNKTTLGNIIPKIGASFQEGNVRLAESAGKTRQRVAEAGGTPLAHLAGLGETIGNVAGETAVQVGNMIAKGTGAAINAIGSDSERVTREFLEGTNITGETNEQTLKRISETMDAVGDQLPEGVRQSFGNFINAVGLYGGKKVVGDPLEAALKTGAQEVAEGGKQILSEGVQQTKAIGAQAVREGKAIAGLPYKAVEAVAKQPTPKTVENVLRETSAADFDRVVKLGSEARETYKNISPMRAVGDRGVEAVEQIQRKLQGLGNDKGRVMGQASVGRKPVGNIAVKFRQELNNYLSGKTAVEGDSKLVKIINAEAQRLGANPTAEQVDKFIDFAQDQLYTAGRDLTVPITEPTTAALRRMIGRLNTNLKNQLPESYSNVNARMSKLYEIRNELNDKLGKDGERGGALMKRIFSPSDNNMQQLAAEVLKETGIDLINEATLARFVMETFGDSRQASLLEQFQIPKSASPEGILQYVGEKLLSGVNSPEEILRRAREMTVDGAPKKINKANEAGISVGLATKNVADNIHPDDLGEMRDFVDYAAGEYRPKNPINLEATATEIAEKYGITLPKTGKNAALADKFARILDKAKLDQKIISDRRKMRGEEVGPKRDDLGRFAANEGKAQGAIPKELEPLAQEARKYKSAEEFVGKFNQDYAEVKVGDSTFTKVYHGTGEKFEKFELQNSKNLGPNAIFFSPSESSASYYARGSHPSIKEAIVKTDNLFDYQNPRDVSKLWSELNTKTKDEIMGFETTDYISMDKIKADISRGQYDIIEKGAVQDAIRKLGYDGFYIKDYTGPKVMGIFNPDVIKTKSQLTDLWKKANARPNF